MFLRGFFIVEIEMPTPQYTQKFRQVWLKDPMFKDWLQAGESS